MCLRSYSWSPATPSARAPTPREERKACCIAEPGFDRIVARSEALGPGVYHVPEARDLIAILAQALDTMLAPLALAEEEDNATTQHLNDRKNRHLHELPALEGDVIAAETIAALTLGRPGPTACSLWDLHEEINLLHSFDT
jgi:hypothetical protein